MQLRFHLFPRSFELISSLMTLLINDDVLFEDDVVWLAHAHNWRALFKRTIINIVIGNKNYKISIARVKS